MKLAVLDQSTLKQEFAFRVSAQVLNHILQITTPIIEEVDIRVAPNGFWFRELDPSHVAMIDFTMKPTGFYDYAPSEDNAPVRINFTQLLKKLPDADWSSYSVKLERKAPLKYLQLSVEGPLTKQAFIPAMEPGAEIYPAPNKTDFSPVTAVVPSENLATVITDLARTSDYCKFIAKDDGLVIATEKTEDYQTEDSYFFKTGPSHALLTYACKKSVKAGYSLNYLRDVIVAMSKATASITLQFNDDHPLKLTANFNDETAQADLYLAPRVEAE